MARLIVVIIVMVSFSIAMLFPESAAQQGAANKKAPSAKQKETLRQATPEQKRAEQIQEAINSAKQFMELEQYKEAAREWEKTFALDPGQIRCHGKELTVAYRELREYASAIAIYRRHITVAQDGKPPCGIGSGSIRDLNLAHMNLFLASLYDAKGDIKEAIQLLQAHYSLIDKVRGIHPEGMDPILWRDDSEMFSNLKLIPEVAARFPILLQADNWKLTDLDASQIEIEYVMRLDTIGVYPRWSPDATEILYTRCDNVGMFRNGCSIWSSKKSGNRKSLVVAGGQFGDWSSDGKRIVYVARDGMHIFDRSQRKDYPLPVQLPSESEVAQKASHPTWDKDASGNSVISILMLQGGLFSQWAAKAILNLDTLQWAVHKVDVMEEARRLINVLPVAQIDVTDKGMQAHGYSAGRHFGFAFHAYFSYKYPAHIEELKVSAAPFMRYAGDEDRFIWLVNRDGSFSYRLTDKGRNPVLSPDGRFIAFEGDGGGIYVARLQKVPSRRQTFAVDLGLKDGIEQGSTMYVYGPKINPLNNKVTGYKEDQLKSAVRVLKATEHKALVELSIDAHPIEASDVVVAKVSQRFAIPQEAKEFPGYRP